MASTCSASATSTSCRRGRLQANPGVNIAALRPYKGYGVIRLSENAGRSIYHSLQISADRRYSNGLKVGAAYTLGKSEDNASNKRNVLWNTYDDTLYEGPSDFDRRHVFSIYYIYDLPFFRDQDTLTGNLLGGWQISGATFFRTGTPFSVVRDQRHRRRRRRRLSVSPSTSSAIPASPNFVLYDGTPETLAFNTAAFALPAAGTFGNAPRNLLLQPRRAAVGHRAVQELRRWAARARCSSGRRSFNFLNHPNLGVIRNGELQGAGWADPTNAELRRGSRARADRADIQLSLRFLF